MVLLELAYFRVARQFGIFDKPNLRSSHTSIVPRGGGIVFLFGAWLFWAFFGMQYSYFILGLSLVGIVSFMDDIRSLAATVRLAVQFVAMGLLFFQLGILNPTDWWMVIVALIVCVGIINAYNFMDGINGITGGYSIAVLLPLIYLNYRTPFISMPYLYVAGLSLLVFCFFNFRNKAKCFAGDVGSISIAFILLFALGLLILQTGDFAYIVFLAVYGTDAFLTICHRIMLHEHLGQAHRKHAYQLMVNELQMHHVTVATIYMALQLVISVGCILLPINNYLYLIGVVVLLSIAYIAFMKRYYHLHEDYLNSQCSDL